MSKAILLRIIRDQNRRQNIRYVIACLTRQERVSGPEISLTRSGDSTIYVAFTAVVTRHREFPVSVSIEKELQVTRRSPGRLIKTVSLVDMSRPAETIASTCSRDELPQTRRCCPRHSGRFPATLDLAEPRNVLRNSLFTEDAAGHRHKHSRTVQTNFHRSASAAAIVVDVLLDHRMDLERKSERFVRHRVLDVLILGLSNRVRFNVLLIGRQLESGKLVEGRCFKLLRVKADSGLARRANRFSGCRCQYRRIVLSLRNLDHRRYSIRKLEIFFVPTPSAGS